MRSNRASDESLAAGHAWHLHFRTVLAPVVLKGCLGSLSAAKRTVKFSAIFRVLFIVLVCERFLTVLALEFQLVQSVEKEPGNLFWCDKVFITLRALWACLGPLLYTAFAIEVFAWVTLLDGSRDHFAYRANEMYFKRLRKAILRVKRIQNKSRLILLDQISHAFHLSVYCLPLGGSVGLYHLII